MTAKKPATKTKINAQGKPIVVETFSKYMKVGGVEMTPVVIVDEVTGVTKRAYYLTDDQHLTLRMLLDNHIRYENKKLEGFLDVKSALGI
jgi:hypothetical protein